MLSVLVMVVSFMVVVVDPPLLRLRASRKSRAASTERQGVFGRKLKNEDE